MSQESHNKGQEDGSKAGLWDQFIHGNNVFAENDPDYDKGWQNGVTHQPADRDDD